MVAFLVLVAVLSIVTIRAAIRNARHIIACHRSNFGRYLSAHETGDILLITAHPDDECMFFSPTIVAIRKSLCSRRRLHLLCLTSGNADGLGKTRRGELEKAARVLGIASVHIHDDHDRLPDSMTRRWSIDDASRIIKSCLGRHKDIGTVVTFDAFGVSGHPNHCDASLAVRKALGETPEAYELFELVTVPLALKYMGMAGIVYEAVGLVIDSTLHHFDRLAEDLTASGPEHYVALIDWREALATGFGAMQCHASQLVWFRYLYLLFSGYMHLNVLAHRKTIAKG